MEHKVRLSLLLSTILLIAEGAFFLILYGEIRVRTATMVLKGVDVQEFMAWVKLCLQVTWACSALFFFGLSYWFSKLILLPFWRVSAIAKELNVERLSFRFPYVRGSSELALMLKSMNTLLQRLEESFLKLSRFAAFVSHEFRTPLTVTSGEVDWLLKKPRTPQEIESSLKKVKASNEQLKGITTRLLTLMEVESIQPSQKANLYLDAFLRQLALHYDDGKKKMVISGQETVVCVHPEILGSIVGNLMENAMKYSSSRIHVLHEVYQGKLELVVEDDGPGVPSDVLPRLGEPFFRLHPEVKNGYGLGLAIVRACVQSCRGAVRFEQASFGGLRVRLQLPV